jgi:hypothetical protein
MSVVDDLAPILEEAGITFDGPKPWDPQVRQNGNHRGDRL